jgi:predicted RNA-binding Zn ribbon-like protein
VVTELKIVGGDPAIDLVNTVGDDRVPDPLVDHGSFASWAVRVGAVDAATARRLAARADEHPATAERALDEARELRTIADAVFRAVATGGEPAPRALAQLVARAGAAVERARIVAAGAVGGPASWGDERGGPASWGDERGGFVLAWGGAHLERPLWPLAVAAVDLLRSGPLEQLKACEGCPWLFLDTSRNHSRRWCSMGDCGSRSKMQRYRERRATAGR